MSSCSPSLPENRYQVKMVRSKGGFPTWNRLDKKICSLRQELPDPSLCSLVRVQVMLKSFIVVSKLFMTCQSSISVAGMA